MPMLAVAIVFAGMIQLPVPDGRECYEYDLFSDVVEAGGGKITQTIETPSFPTIKRLFIVTLDGTKETYAATATCVVVPAIFVDAPNDLSPVPYLKLLPPKPAA